MCHFCHNHLVESHVDVSFHLHYRCLTVAHALRFCFAVAAPVEPPKPDTRGKRRWKGLRDRVMRGGVCMNVACLCVLLLLCASVSCVVCAADKELAALYWLVRPVTRSHTHTHAPHTHTHTLIHTGLVIFAVHADHGRLVSQ